MKHLNIILLIGLLISCSGEKNNQSNSDEQSASEVKQSLKSGILGEWNNMSMKIIIESLNKTHQDSVVEVPKGKWETILNIKPIKTVFKEDGTFTSEYRNLADSIVSVSTGTWSADGDTLSMTSDGNTVKYFAKITDNQAEFKGYVDWDQDGEQDDLYTGIQKKNQ
ncbi:hypothetical protein QQ020_29995 [Fulvivirgaceae bacterium BMA12]|uniref:Lipoprotein n=1 Tax=Agaribacillus aureus TaxID=3051825 RepID=A0ABT8LFI5_9BACT|nr:hypothetical protein [Fulvivirgaceae bacterium BMA12]